MSRKKKQMQAILELHIAGLSSEYSVVNVLTDLSTFSDWKRV